MRTNERVAWLVVGFLAAMCLGLGAQPSIPDVIRARSIEIVGNGGKQMVRIAAVPEGGYIETFDAKEKSSGFFPIGGIVDTPQGVHLVARELNLINNEGVPIMFLGSDQRGAPTVKFGDAIRLLMIDRLKEINFDLETIKTRGSNGLDESDKAERVRRIWSLQRERDALQGLLERRQLPATPATK